MPPTTAAWLDSRVLVDLQNLIDLGLSERVSVPQPSKPPLATSLEANVRRSNQIRQVLVVAAAFG